MTPPPGVAAALSAPVREMVVVRRRIMLLDEHPVELTGSNYPAHMAHGTLLTEPKTIPAGAITLLAV
ncbi:MAG: hypothetical protein ACRDRI_17855 [Pseudonocardiaceae bacterium]